MSKVWALEMAEAFYGRGAYQTGENYMLRDVLQPIAHQIKYEDARRLVASWNALADVPLEDLERDRVLAHPGVAGLVTAARELCVTLEETNPQPETLREHARMTRKYLDVRKALKVLETKE